MIPPWSNKNGSLLKRTAGGTQEVLECLLA